MSESEKSRESSSGKEMDWEAAWTYKTFESLHWPVKKGVSYFWALLKHYKKLVGESIESTGINIFQAFVFHFKNMLNALINVLNYMYLNSNKNIKVSINNWVKIIWSIILTHGPLTYFQPHLTVFICGRSLLRIFGFLLTSSAILWEQNFHRADVQSNINKTTSNKP